MATSLWWYVMKKYTTFLLEILQTQPLYIERIYYKYAKKLKKASCSLYLRLDHDLLNIVNINGQLFISFSSFWFSFFVIFKSLQEGWNLKRNNNEEHKQST